MTITQAFKKFGDKLKENILSIANKRSKDLNYSPAESSDISTKGYVDDIANKKTSLPTDDSGVVQHGTAGQVAVSDGSGGITWSDLLQPDWEQNDETASDYVKNKPFYSTAITLLSSWDGDTTGLDMVSCADWNDYRIGDAIPYEDIIGATIYFSDSTNIKIKKEDVYIESSVYWNIYFSNIGSGDIQLSSVAEDNYAIYTKAGLYHSNMSDAYITKIVKEEVKTIDSKYLPDHVHSWNNIEDKPTADDALALLAEVGMIDPIVDSNGSIYIEENNVIYTL